jgi:hypothetical protein
MGIAAKLKHELRSLALATLYFGLFIGTLMLLKVLLLEEYELGFAGWSRAVIGTLVLSKVVLLLERVSLGAWVRARPAWVDVVLRTALYVAGTAAVLVIEKGLDERHESGGFIAALRASFAAAEVHHFWITVVCVTWALLGYNVLSVLRRHLGAGGLLRLFRSPLPRVRPAHVTAEPVRPS